VFAKRTPEETGQKQKKDQIGSGTETIWTERRQEKGVCSSVKGIKKIVGYQHWKRLLP